MVFFDLDGTLLDEEKRVHPQVIHAIQQLKNNGVWVGIATGRAPFMMEELRSKLGIDHYVTFNGQYVVGGKDVIYKNPLKAKELQALDETAKSKGHPMVFLDHLKMRANKQGDKDIETGLANLKADYPPVDPNFYRNRDIYQALLFCRLEDEGAYNNGQSPFQFIRWHDLSMDVLPATGSKALGIERVIDRLGVKLENTYAFGDGLNDIEMLEFVGTGVAMGNAFEATKKAADWVTGNVADAGVVQGLKHLKLLA